MITWTAEDVAATARLNKALRDAGISRRHWDAMTEAQRLVALGAGDEPVRVTAGLDCPTCVLTADGSERMERPADGWQAEVRRLLGKAPAPAPKSTPAEPSEAVVAALSDVVAEHFDWVLISPVNRRG